ncbi:MAG TPA: diguanylate cyclase, partial [Clostridiales bacterium]|nr:diguanylate cyclase [Clostridiales bacterium]
MADVLANIKLLLILMVAAILLSSGIYLKLANKLLRPIHNLIGITDRFSRGDLSQRAVIVRNDEIGRLSESFNKMADTICTLINDLEEKVKERTLELEKANKLLKESKDQLQLILDSTAEGIYGVDIEGKCTFCNKSALKMLGYKHQDELIGKNMHLQIHHSDRDGNPIPQEDCKMFQVFVSGEGVYAEDEVFWRADGTSFDVECYSYPQYKDGKIVGAVITFTDNTERKKREEHIRYLSYYDPLTGVYNRAFFENELKRVDTKKNLPLSVIFGDINHLKLTNDIFGHASGDELLRKTAQVLRSTCREEDIIARVGGDEFAILLPNTEAKDARKIIDRIKNELSKEKILAVKCSMAMGYDTKISSDQKIDEVVKNAESQMYREKIVNQQSIRYDMLKTILESLHHKSPRAKQHSIMVSELCEAISRAMKMPETEVRRVRDTAFVHDIGKVILDEALLNKNDQLTEEEKKEIQQHPVVGYRILNLCDETLDLAEGVLNHHERWDGKGYPKGLKGEEISKAARIIAVAEAYEEMTSPMNENAVSKEEALEEIKKESGAKFDPEVVDVFIEIMA